MANSGPSSNGGDVGALPWTLKDGSVTTAGGWAALDCKTGAVLWTTKDPQGSRAEAAVSGANGVIFGYNLAPGAGTMRALDAKSGALLWSYDSGGPCNAGPSIADGMVYWGSGTIPGFAPRRCSPSACDPGTPVGAHGAHGAPSAPGAPRAPSSTARACSNATSITARTAAAV